MSLSNNFGQLKTTYKLLKIFQNNSNSVFSTIATKWNEEKPANWNNFDFKKCIPELIAADDGPMEKIQPKHPNIIIISEGGSPITQGINYSYNYEISYTYATPQIFDDIDVTNIACQFAQECIYTILKQHIHGIGYVVNSWNISELREAAIPAPMFSRSLALSLTLEVEEDF